MTLKTLCQPIMLLSFFSLPMAAQEMTSAAAQPVVKPTIIQSTTASGPSAPITLSLQQSTSVGNMLVAIVGDGVYVERTFNPPDSSWVCSPGAGGSIRINTCTHVIVTGDGTSYTFVPTTTDGGGASGVLFEVSGAVSAQAAYSYNGSQSSLNAANTPSLVPSSQGMLAISATYGGQLASARDSGWSTVQSVQGIGVFASNTLTTDTTTPLATGFSYVYTNYGNSLQELLLLTPGTFLPAPVASPAAGSYPTMQQVTLSDASTGAAIHYTLDGTMPSCSSPTYSSPIAIGSSSSLSFVACATGYANSAVQVVNYVVAGGTLAGVSLGPLADLHGYTPFAGDLYHQDISANPVDGNSNNIIAGIGSGHLHHDWSSVNGGNYGIPYTVVDSSVTPLVPFTNNLYSDESDLTLYPIPTTLAIESTPPPCTTTGDNHAIILDKYTGVDYEFYLAQYCPGNTPTWQVGNGVLWDMTINEKRPYTYTSVDAAGLSVFEGLIRYDEIVAGAINHAIRFTTSLTRCDHYDYGDGAGSFVPPATHASCNNSGTLNVMGMRLRLKASFDISNYSPTNQIILTAMKKYGMILADNGSTLFYQGTPDARWNDDDLHVLDAIASTSFEVLQMPTVFTNDSHPTGAAPVINHFGANSSTISQGQSVTLSAAVTGASYSYVDLGGFMRGSSMTVSPTKTTTYTLTSRNAFGSTNASTTVTVVPAAYKDPGLAFAPVATQTLGNAPFAVSASSQSSGQITYSVMSGPATIAGATVTVNGIGTVVLQASQVTAGIYTAGTATATFQVNGLSPGLAFTPIPDVVFGALPFLVSANSSSSATITYSVVSGGATISGRTVTVKGAGTVTLQATEAAAGQYSGATVQATFTVKPAVPTLAFVPVPNQTYGSAPFTVYSTSNSSGGNVYSVVSGPATIYGNRVAVTGVGKVVLMVSQMAAGNYAAGTATATFKVLAAQPQLSFAPIPAKTYGAPSFPATASSVSNGPISYSVAGGSAAVYGNVVTLTGAGTVTLQANQAATADYLAASAIISFTVNLERPAVSLLVSSTELPFLTPLSYEVLIAGTGNKYPTGAVQVFDGSSLIGSYALKATDGGFLRTLQLTGMVAGQHTLTAVYSGDANYQGTNSGVVAVTVDPKPTRSSLR